MNYREEMNVILDKVYKAGYNAGYNAGLEDGKEQKEPVFKIGDEVTDNDGWNGVVTCISPDGEYLVVTLQDGSALRWEKEHFKKTGRRFPEIVNVLKQMQEGEE